MKNRYFLHSPKENTDDKWHLMMPILWQDLALLRIQNETQKSDFWQWDTMPTAKLEENISYIYVSTDLQIFKCGLSGPQKMNLTISPEILL